MNALAGRCAGAIRRAGDFAQRVRGGERAGFYASIQPQGGGDAPEQSPLGFGISARYTLYASCEGAGGALVPGDAVECGGRRYRVLSAETFRAAGEAVYCRAALQGEDDL